MLMVNSYGTTEDQPEQRKLANAKWSWPKSGLPMWRAPPPPTEPITSTTLSGWTEQKSQTERKLFGNSSSRSLSSERGKNGTEDGGDE